LSTYYVDVWITEMAGQLLLFISEPGMHKLIILRKGFLDNKEDIAKLCKSFVGLWSLDNEGIVRSAIEKPDLFVLKPQREGGEKD